MITSKAEFDAHKFSANGELMLEVLTARRRLGEQLWTFSKRYWRVAKGELEPLGMIEVMHGNVDNTFRAALTERAWAWNADPFYVPPIVGKVQRACAQLAQERFARRTVYEQVAADLGFDPLGFASPAVDQGKNDLGRLT